MICPGCDGYGSLMMQRAKQRCVEVGGYAANGTYYTADHKQMCLKTIGGSCTVCDGRRTVPDAAPVGERIGAVDQTVLPSGVILVEAVPPVEELPSDDPHRIVCCKCGAVSKHTAWQLFQRRTNDGFRHVYAACHNPTPDCKYYTICANCPYGCPACGSTCEFT